MAWKATAGSPVGVQLFDNGVREKLESLKKGKANEILRRSLEDGAKVTAFAMKNYVPDDTGLLKKSIGHKSGTKRGGNNQSFALAGPRRGYGAWVVKTRKKDRKGKKRFIGAAPSSVKRSVFQNPTRYGHLASQGHRDWRSGKMIRGNNWMRKSRTRTQSIAEAAIKAGLRRRLKLGFS